jgi:undecaprenyl diphosphate synthase
MHLNHLAIIMDGNRRWAVSNNLDVYEGHRKGAENLWSIVQKTNEFNIKYLTLFGFSTENWKRSQKEVYYLLSLLEQFLDDANLKIKKYNYKIRFIGDLLVFDQNIQEKISVIKELTIENTGLVITLALNYGGRYDIVNAANQFFKFNKNKSDPIQMKEADFKEFTYNKEIPDPDLLIRTGGEIRISNFLLWDLAYTELIFLPEMWPDFCKTLLEKCILEYSKRNRKYGE